MHRIKKISLFPFIIFVIILSLLYLNVNAANVITKPLFNKILVAKRGMSTKVYKLNTTLSVVFNNESKSVNKIKGFLVDVSNDSIFILPFKKRSVIKGIALNDIESVYKLHKKGRKGQIVILSLLLLFVAVGLALPQSGNLILLFFYGIPAVALFTVLPFYIANYAADLFTKKSIKKGWLFSAQE